MKTVDHAQLVQEFVARGIRLTVVDGELVVDAPRGSLTAGDKDILRQNKVVLLNYLADLCGWDRDEEGIHPADSPALPGMKFPPFNPRAATWAGAFPSGPPSWTVHLEPGELGGPDPDPGPVDHADALVLVGNLLGRTVTAAEWTATPEDLRAALIQDSLSTPSTKGPRA